MNIQEFKANIPSFLEQAIDIVDHISNVKIDKDKIDIESLSILDDVVLYMNNLFKKDLINDTVARNAAVSLGVLLGEIIISKNPLYWDMNEEEIPVLRKNENSYISPITKVYKIITDMEDEEGTPSGFYSGYLALEKWNAMSDDEKEAITVHILEDEE